jgi:folate-binding Fe-S cluster repair protein YgfZ
MQMLTWIPVLTGVEMVTVVETTLETMMDVVTIEAITMVIVVAITVAGAEIEAGVETTTAAGVVVHGEALPGDMLLNKHLLQRHQQRNKFN